MRADLRRLLGTRPAGSTLGAAASVLERVGRRRSHDLAVLTYHRIDEPEARPHLHPGLISATPAGFAAQLRELDRRANPVGLDDVLAAMRGDRRLPEQPVMVTVDDGYADFSEHAWPSLRQLGIPVILFVPTAYPGDPGRRFWWDRLSHALRTTDRSAFEVDGVVHDLRDGPGRLRAFRQLRAVVKSAEHRAGMARVEAWCASLGLPDAPAEVLDWAALRALAADGVTIAPHTRTHPLLTRLDAEAAVDEIAGSRADLERELGSSPPVFAYPSGAHDDAAVAIVGSLGFEQAFTTVRGRNDLRRSDALRLRRINVGQATTPALLRLQLIRGLDAPLSALDRG